jgi:hypothetical protein
VPPWTTSWPTLGCRMPLCAARKKTEPSSELPVTVTHCSRVVVAKSKHDTRYRTNLASTPCDCSKAAAVRTFQKLGNKPPKRPKFNKIATTSCAPRPWMRKSRREEKSIFFNSCNGLGNGLDWVRQGRACRLPVLAKGGQRMIENHGACSRSKAWDVVWARCLEGSAFSFFFFYDCHFD